LERFGSGWRERLAVGPERDRALADQFERLAATLLDLRRTQSLRTVMVTSAVPGDGKTLTSLNVALVLSESYRQRVLLLECDLRRPSLASALGLPLASGLSDAIHARGDHAAAYVELTDRLTVLPAGRPDPDPLSGLVSAGMQAVLRDAAEKFDWVILDTPPLGAAADAGLLTPLVDGIVLVVRAGATSLQAVQRTVEALGQEKIIGVVLNGAHGGASESDYGSYYHYEASSPTPGA
jgi:receptor protein-tyrosine kinase